MISDEPKQNEPLLIDRFDEVKGDDDLNDLYANRPNEQRKQISARTLTFEPSGMSKTDVIRGIKRSLIEYDDCEEDDEYDPRIDGFLKKIQETKKLKSKDVDTEHMKFSRKPERWYIQEDRLETISECGEMLNQVNMPSAQTNWPDQTSSNATKAHSQVVRCKIPFNVATASPAIAASPTSTRSTMYRRLQSEHLQLQRSFALLRQLVAETSTGSFLQSEKASHFEDERNLLLEATKTLQTKVHHLQEKVQEYQEQNELLEFRILELDHCQPQVPKDVRDYGCNTDLDSAVLNNHDCLQNQIEICQDFNNKYRRYAQCDDFLSENTFAANRNAMSSEDDIKVLQYRNDSCSSPLLIVTEPSSPSKSISPPANCDLIKSKMFESRVVGLTPTSEDEGLGDDASRRESSTGPSSLDYRDTESDGMNTSSDFADDLDTSSRLSESTDLDLSSKLELQNELFKVSRHLKAAEDQIEELKNVVDRKEDQIVHLLTENGPNQSARTILMLEEKLAECETNREELQEQVLELEEAENDARLESQTLQGLVDNLKYKEMEYETDLVDAKLRMEDFDKQVSSSNALNEELRTQICYLQELVEKYEEHIEDLERDKYELKLKLDTLNQKPIGQDSEPLKSTTITISTQTSPKLEMVTKLDQITQTDTLPLSICQKASIDGNLFTRLQQLEEKDDLLKDQLHMMDDKNLKLWQKLHDVDASITECRRIDRISSDDSGTELMHCDAASRLDDLLSISDDGKTLDDNVNSLLRVKTEPESMDSTMGKESKLKNRLNELETINREFEKELGIREKLWQQKDNESRQFKTIEIELNEAIQQLKREQEVLNPERKRLEIETDELNRSLVETQQRRVDLMAFHRQELESLKLRQTELLWELQEKVKSLEEQKKENEERIKTLEREKKILLEQLANGKDAQELPVIRYQIGCLKTAQNELGQETNRALMELRELNQVLSDQLTVYIDKQKDVEKECQEEIFSLQTEEENCKMKIGELSEICLKLETNLAEKELELENARKLYEKKLQLIEEEHHLVEKELQWKLKEMEEGTTVAVKALETKRKQLELNLQDDLQDLRLKENSYKHRITTLEQHVDSLRQEVNNFASSNCFATTMEHQELHYDGHQVGEDTFECLSVEERLEELEKKEAAYLETLENADKIISQMELSYRVKIGDLESSEKCLQQRVSQLEESEQKLKSALQSERRSADGWKISDLVKELMDAEAREHSLKEHLDELESSQKSLVHKNGDLERKNHQLRDELGEHDEMCSKLENFRFKVESLQEEVSRIKASELALKETLSQADELLSGRETALLHRVEELDQEKQETQEMVKQLREQVHFLQDKLESAQMECAVMDDAKVELSRRITPTNLEIDLKKRVAQLENALRFHHARLESGSSASESETGMDILGEPNNAESSNQENGSLCLCGSIPDNPNVVELDEDVNYSGGMKDLDEYFKRAVEAVERDIKQQPNTMFVFPTSISNNAPASPSTSGCESDAGSECHWSGSVHQTSVSEEESWDSDHSGKDTFRPQKHVVMTKDLPELMKTKVIYPTFTKMAVKEDCVFLTRHSQDDSVNSSNNEETSKPEAPSNFRVLRQVGKDSLLVGWCPPQKNTSVQSYEILVGGQLHQHARSPDRTKALLHKLNLKQGAEAFTIAIRTVSENGSLSSSTEMTYDPSVPIKSSQTAEQVKMVDTNTQNLI